VRDQVRVQAVLAQHLAKRNDSRFVVHPLSLSQPWT